MHACLCVCVFVFMFACVDLWLGACHHRCNGGRAAPPPTAPCRRASRFPAGLSAAPGMRAAAPTPRGARAGGRRASGCSWCTRAPVRGRGGAGGLGSRKCHSHLGHGANDLLRRGSQIPWRLRGGAAHLLRVLARLAQPRHRRLPLAARDEAVAVKVQKGEPELAGARRAGRVCVFVCALQ